MLEHIKASLTDAKQALDTFLADEAGLQRVERAANVLLAAFNGEGRIFTCGNGGSMCDAMHFAEEFTGRFRNDRSGLPATAISDPSHMSCVANDFGYDQVFSRYLEAHGRKGDVLLAISTSGKSPSIIMAVTSARNLGMKVIGLTGKAGSEFEPLCDVCICAPAGQYADRVQEMHIEIIHILIELVERSRFPENY